MEKDIALQEEIVKELVENLDAWMVLELEKEENYLINSEESFEVLCPICQKHSLYSSRESTQIYNCSCGQTISFNGDLNELKFKINKSVLDHESKQCNEIIRFFVEQKDKLHILSFFCPNCDFYGSI